MRARTSKARAVIVVAVAVVVVVVAGCGGGGGDSSSPVSTAPATAAQMVFMYPPEGRAPPPGPGARHEVAVMNLDGSGFRQLTHDGTFKFLPHFSPDGTKIVYTKFAVGAYGSPDAQMDVAVLDIASGRETMITRGGTNAYGTCRREWRAGRLGLGGPHVVD